VLQAKLQSAYAGSPAPLHGNTTQGIQFELDFCAASAKMQQDAGLTFFCIPSKGWAPSVPYIAQTAALHMPVTLNEKSIY
jgi:hypothetical protein